MEAIRLWFNGKRDYASGVKLYMIHGSDRLLKRSFLEPETPYKKRRLTDELQKLLPASPTVNSSASKPVIRVRIPDPGAAPAAQEQAEPRPVPGKYVWSENQDEVERSIHLRWKPLFVEMMDLVSRVGDMAEEGEKDPAKKQEAGRMALRILQLDDEIEDIYQERDFYLKNGKTVEKYPYGEPCLDPRIMPQKLQNHRRYLREMKSKLKANPDNTDAALLMQKHQWFVDYYSGQLNKE